MDVPVYTIEGEEAGAMTIDEQSLGGEVNPALLKQAFVRYHANRRQGSARTRNRSLVEGSTRKLFRQKGTGRARMGMARTPIRRGGGVTFAKTRGREAFRQDMPVKMRRKANRNALLAKLVDGEVKVLQAMDFAEPKTKAFEAMIDALGVDRSCLVAIDPANRNARLSARNVPGVDTLPPAQMTCYELLNHRFLVIARADLEAWLDGPSAGTDKRAKAHARSRTKTAGASS
ncbi:MAG: 50S ribosomal protein L4 [Planctomycetota bacterium]|nr:MAG: 50S ribosomal protein L4 [Planctomycetota bacterium]